ncbi:major facilitator superfamily domain-containing protein [Coniella lustricola]|uniref:Major facilitator superfamily domain-containing protein n=1 Tax=Coniella lustricola TaxID=2025994 RepID=A0A2T3ANW8_9PEZI|nr:major facilitator superfamily domain-containing protein [Coniella lustricola]
MIPDQDIEADSGSSYRGPSPAKLERLGRQRPKVFQSTAQEILFCTSMLLAQIMSEYFISGFNIFLPQLTDEMQIPDRAQVWPSSVFALVAGAFLLPFGRLSDIFGGYVVFTGGMAWYCVWTLACGFSADYKMLIACRALQGLGAAAYMPATVMNLGKTYRPGPRKNLVFGLYGACAPLGFYFGILIAGISNDLLSWRWYFWIAAIAMFVICIGGLLSIPKDVPAKITGNMDYWGVLTIVPPLVLIVYGITDGAYAPDGWRTGYIIASLVVGVLLLGVATYVEGWVSTEPLLPGSMFKPRHMKTLVVALMFAYGTWGVFMYYSSFYLINVMGYSTLQTALAFTPMVVGGIIIASVGGFTLHLLPGRLLMVISGLGFILSVLMFALLPVGGSYWAYVLPSMIGSTVGIDITYNVSNVFITTNIPLRHQGAAGALINSLFFFPVSLFLGVADVVSAEYADQGQRTSYKAALWFGTGCAAAALLLFCFIDPGKAVSQLRAEEKEEQDQHTAAQPRGGDTSCVVLNKAS